MGEPVTGAVSRAFLANDRRLYLHMVAAAVLAAAMLVLAIAQIIAAAFAVLPAVRPGGPLSGPAARVDAGSLTLPLDLSLLVVAVIAAAAVGTAFVARLPVEALVAGPFDAIRRLMPMLPRHRLWYARSLRDDPLLLTAVAALRPDLAVDRVLVHRSAGGESAIRGRTLLLSRSDANRLLSIGTGIATGRTMRHGPDDVAAAVHLLAHEACHRHVGEARLAPLYARAIFVAAFLTGGILTLALVRHLPTPVAVLLFPAAVVAMIAVAHFVHQRCAGLEIFNELRAEHFASRESGRRYPPADEVARWSVLDRRYPDRAEYDRYMRSGVSGRAREAAIALTTCAATAVGLHGGSSLLVASSPFALPMILLAAGYLWCALRIGRCLRDVAEPRLDRTLVLTLVPLALAPPVACTLAAVAPSAALPGLLWSLVAVGLVLGPGLAATLTGRIARLLPSPVPITEQIIQLLPRPAAGAGRRTGRIAGPAALLRLHTYARYAMLVLALALCVSFVTSELDTGYAGLPLTAEGVATGIVVIAALLASFVFPDSRLALLAETTSLVLLAAVVTAVAAFVSIVVGALGDMPDPLQGLAATDRLRRGLFQAAAGLSFSPDVQRDFFVRWAASFVPTAGLVAVTAALRLRYLEFVRKEGRHGTGH